MHAWYGVADVARKDCDVLCVRLQRRAVLSSTFAVHARLTTFNETLHMHAGLQHQSVCTRCTWLGHIVATATLLLVHAS